MARGSSEMLEQMSADLIRIFEHGPRSDCRPLTHGCIALSGEPVADLNMIVLTSGAERSELDEALDAVRQKNTDAILIVEEGADVVRGWAADAAEQAKTFRRDFAISVRYLLLSTALPCVRMIQNGTQRKWPWPSI